MIVVQLLVTVRAVRRQIQAFAPCKFAPFQTVVFLSNICNVCKVMFCLDVCRCKFQRGCRNGNPRLSLVMYKVGWCYLHPPPKEIPPQQTKSATMRSRQVGLTLRLKFFILPPQQHKNRIMSKIHVQLHPPRHPPPFSPYPHPPSLNIPLNIFYLRLPNNRLCIDCKVYFTIWIFTKKCYFDAGVFSHCA